MTEVIDGTHQELNFNGRRESEMKTNNVIMKDSKNEPIYNYMKLDVDKRTNMDVINEKMRSRRHQ